MTKWAMGVLLVCAASLGLAACASTPTTHGSLHYVDEGTQWCEPTSLYNDAGIGLPLDHSGKAPITIKAIKVDGAQGVELVKAWVMPVDEHLRVGSTGWPLQGYDSDWAKRVPAEGADIEAGAHKDLVLHVRRSTQKGGQIKDFHVEYVQAGVEHTADTHTALVMKPDC